jgi:peptidoglycan hydrolase-like protein with peptidoglycan-binding domain
MRYKEFRIVEADAGETDSDNPTQGELDDIAGAKAANQQQMISSEALTAGPPYPREEIDAVKALQTKLEELGYSVGNTGIDGKYGPRTTRAVRAFKRDYNIQGDGLTADAATLQKLDSVISGATPRIERPTSIVPGSDGLEYPISNSRIESIIRDEAELRGIDPDIAVRIFRAEGRSSYQSTVPRTGRGSLNGREASFGPYQLYIGGGLGNDYQDQTGRDLTQDNTEDGITNQIRFALDAAVRQSWQPWYGRGPAGVGRYDGLRGARQARNWS